MQRCEMWSRKQIALNMHRASGKGNFHVKIYRYWCNLSRSFGGFFLLLLLSLNDSLRFSWPFLLLNSVVDHVFVCMRPFIREKKLRSLPFQADVQSHGTFTGRKFILHTHTQTDKNTWHVNTESILITKNRRSTKSLISSPVKRKMDF